VPPASAGGVFLRGGKSAIAGVRVTNVGVNSVCRDFPEEKIP